MSTSHRMTPLELRASLSLAGVFGLRLLGMFIILPVFALYAEQLRGGDDHTLIGLALGAYGLTQAVLQIPFGSLSDRWGRKKTIYLGLLIFAAGSFTAAVAQDIHVVILGRVIQGAGAISAAVMALAADLTRDEQRTKAMAIIGVTIGVAFALSMVGGPVLNRWIGVPGIFALTGLLALFAIAIVRFVVPTPAMAVPVSGIASRVRFIDILRHPQLLRLNYGIFILSAVLMALWVVVPFELRAAGLPGDSHWQIYLPVMVMSVVLMVPPMLISERWGRQKTVFLAAIGILLVAQLLLAGLWSSLWGLALALLVFFTGFNYLEASLPSMISRTAPPEARGAAVGVYSSAQFLGSFVGAWAGGAISQHLGFSSVFAFCAALTLSWLIVAVGMKQLPGLRTRTYPVPKMDSAGAEGLSRRLAGVAGVREALVFASEGVAYLKVDSTRFDERNVLKLLSGEV